LFRGELDWIVMRAMEKDRNRRYETASAFAADVQRYLHDEPVQACPPSRWYRLRKFARRNKAALATGLFLVIAVVGLAVSTVLVWQARIEAEQQRDAARKHAAQAEAQRLRVERNLRQACDVVIHLAENAAQGNSVGAQTAPELKRRTLELAVRFFQ